MHGPTQKSETKNQVDLTYFIGFLGQLACALSRISTSYWQTVT